MDVQLLFSQLTFLLKSFAMRIKVALQGENADFRRRFHSIFI
jgi:heme-degrading monooxygenase HmoA